MYSLTYNYRQSDGGGDDDDDDLNNDQWYETFSADSEEKVYDDLCSVISSKVDHWLRSVIVKCLPLLLLSC